MAVNGRQKGNRAERKLAKLFAQWWGSDFTRTPMSGGFATKQFRDDWNASGDLVTPDERFPFTVESKHVEGWDLEQTLVSDKTKIHSWWAQTLNETPDNKIPLLVFTRNRKPLLAMLPYEDFCYMEEVRGAWFRSMVLHLAIDGTWQKVGVFALEELFLTPTETWLTYGEETSTDSEV